MKKYWVRVNGKNNFPHDAHTVAIYGTIEEARAYAYEHECNHYYGTNVVQIFDNAMNLIEEYEV